MPFRLLSQLGRIMSKNSVHLNSLFGNRPTICFTLPGLREILFHSAIWYFRMGLLAAKGWHSLSAWLTKAMSAQSAKCMMLCSARVAATRSFLTLRSKGGWALPIGATGPIVAIRRSAADGGLALKVGPELVRTCRDTYSSCFGRRRRWKRHPGCGKEPPR